MTSTGGDPPRAPCPLVVLVFALCVRCGTVQFTRFRIHFTARDRFRGRIGKTGFTAPVPKTRFHPI